MTFVPKMTSNFWQSVWTSVKVKSKNYCYFTDFFTKIYSLLTHVRKTPPLRSHYTTRYCENGSQTSRCTRSENLLGKSEEICYCDEDLCNTGNLNKELSYLLMGITIGFQIVMNYLVVWKYIVLRKTWF